MDEGEPGRVLADAQAAEHALKADEQERNPRRRTSRTRRAALHSEREDKQHEHREPDERAEEPVGVLHEYLLVGLGFQCRGGGMAGQRIEEHVRAVGPGPVGHGHARLCAGDEPADEDQRRDGDAGDDGQPRQPVGRGLVKGFSPRQKSADDAGDEPEDERESQKTEHEKPGLRDDAGRFTRCGSGRAELHAEEDQSRKSGDQARAKPDGNGARRTHAGGHSAQRDEPAEQAG